MTTYPEEYTDGYVIFMGQRFSVDPRVLIPRFETEELVKYCLKLLRENPEIQTIADIGTGSGIIPITLANKCDRPLNVLASDMSPDALDLAKENYEKISGRAPLSRSSTLSEQYSDRLRLEEGVAESRGGSDSDTEPPFNSPLDRGARGDQAGDFNFLQGDLLQPLIAHFGKEIPDSILITANLPYVREKEINSGLIHEPRMAFLGGVQTGFELYERFFDQLLAWKKRPKNCHVVIEFGLWQRDIAETVFQKLGFKYSFFADLRGIERFACLEL